MCAKLKIKIFVYFVTNVFSFILNIVSTNLHHENENKQKGTDAFDISRNKKSGAIFYVLKFVIYLSFVIINGNILK